MSENPGKFNDFVHILKNIKQSTEEETATWKYATYRVKNAGYTKIFYIQEVFLTNSNEIRNVYCKKKNGHNGKNIKLGFMLLLC
jgi:cobalamin biosynthesis Co2+ chelatase CbiK